MTSDKEGDGDRGLGTLIRAEASYHAAPAALRARIVRELRASGTRQAGPRRWLAHVAGFGAAFACGVIATWLFVALQSRPVPDGIDNEIVAAHVRSLLASHVTDVASSDRHTVKPWLSARLDFSPPVYDLGAEGFPLVGGRLDYIDQRPVAALVYHRNQHVINVFVWPIRDTKASAPAPASRNGFNTVSWDQVGSSRVDLQACKLEYSIVSPK